MHLGVGHISTALSAALFGAICVAPTAHAASALQQWLDVFEAVCFPNIDTLEIVEKHIANSGWKRAELGTNPLLDQALGNFATAPDALIQTISVDSFMLQASGNTYFLIYRKSRANDEAEMAINSCHVYDFAAKADWSAEYFEGWRASALMKYRYLNVRGAFYTSESEPAERPKDGKLLTGIHFTASNFASKS
jgi:carbamoylphosphate synthase small subunit